MTTSLSPLVSANICQQPASSCLLGLQDEAFDKVGGILIRPLLCVCFTSYLTFLCALLFSAKNQLLAPLLLTELGSTPTEKDGNTAADLQGLRDLHA